MSDANMTPEQAGWLIGKIVAIGSAVAVAVLGLIRLVNRPMQQDIDTIKKRLSRGDREIDENARAIQEIKSDVRDINTRLLAHFSEEAEQRRAERISREWLRQARQIGWKPPPGGDE